MEAADSFPAPHTADLAICVPGGGEQRRQEGTPQRPSTKPLRSLHWGHLPDPCCVHLADSASSKAWLGPEFNQSGSATTGEWVSGLRTLGRA